MHHNDRNRKHYNKCVMEFRGKPCHSFFSLFFLQQSSTSQEQHNQLLLVFLFNMYKPKSFHNITPQSPFTHAPCVSRVINLVVQKFLKKHLGLEKGHWKERENCIAKEREKSESFLRFCVAKMISWCKARLVYFVTPAISPCNKTPTCKSVVLNSCPRDPLTG